MDGIDLSGLSMTNITWVDAVFAIVAVLVGWIVSIFVYRGVLAVLRKTPNVSESIAVLVARVAKYGMILLGAGIALSFLGSSLQPVLAITLIIIVVAVLVLRGIADNFAAGVVLQTRHPLKLGDEIEFDDIVGTVTELNGRSVVVHTVDGRTVHVPNAQVTSAPIINHSARGARRSDVQVRVARAGVDIAELMALLKATTSDVDGVHIREAVRPLAVAVSPTRITISVQFWHHPLKAVPVRSGVVLAISHALDTAGFVGTVTSDPGPAPLIPQDGL